MVLYGVLVVVVQKAASGGLPVEGCLESGLLECINKIVPRELQLQGL